MTHFDFNNWWEDCSAGISNEEDKVIVKSWLESQFLNTEAALQSLKERKIPSSCKEGTKLAILTAVKKLSKFKNFNFS